jgi:hypothetical protein
VIREFQILNFQIFELGTMPNWAPAGGEWFGERLSVRQGFVKARRGFGQLAGFEDCAAVQALQVFRFGVLGDDLRASVAAGWGVVHGVLLLRE